MVSRVSANLAEEVVIDRLRRLADAPGTSWAEFLPQLQSVIVRFDALILATAKPARGYRSKLHPGDEVEELEDAVQLTIRLG